MAAFVLVCLLSILMALKIRARLSFDFTILGRRNWRMTCIRHIYGRRFGDAFCSTGTFQGSMFALTCWTRSDLERGTWFAMEIAGILPGPLRSPRRSGTILRHASTVAQTPSINLSILGSQICSAEVLFYGVQVA